MAGGVCRGSGGARFNRQSGRTGSARTRRGVSSATARAASCARCEHRRDQRFQDRVDGDLRRRRRRHRRRRECGHRVSGRVDQQAGRRDGRSQSGVRPTIRPRRRHQQPAEVVEAADRRFHPRSAGDAAVAAQPHIGPRRRLRIPGLPPVGAVAHARADSRRAEAVQRRAGADGAAATDRDEVLRRRRDPHAARDD